MRVAFLYNEPAEDPAETAEDCDPERSPIVAALRLNGHDVVALPCTLDLETVRRQLKRLRPDVVFNRVESLGGSDALPAALMLLLDVLEISYTGCPTEPFLATSDKLAVKERLRAAGLPTPEWIAPETTGLSLPAPCQRLAEASSLSQTRRGELPAIPATPFRAK
jgi:D-alanine-D-alanine ligase